MSRRATGREGSRRPAGRLRALPVVVVLLGAGLGPPSGIAGQTAEELVQRLDSLTPLLEDARVAAERAGVEAQLRAQAELGITLDTLRVGPLMVVAPEEQAPDARRAFETAWEEIGPYVGDATHVLEDGIWVFQHAPRFHRIRLPLAPDAGEIHHVRVRSWRPWEEVVRGVEASVWGRLATRVPREAGTLIRGWPWQPEGSEFLETAYRNLVTSPGRPTRACVRGDVEACWTAMGTDGLPERWSEWYEPAERRRFALERTPSVAVQQTRHDACRRGSQAACDLYLEAWREPEIPVQGVAGAGLVGYAIELGGEGSYQRLHEAEGEEVRDALAHVAGLEADEVMRRWRALVLENRPEIGEGVGRSQWSALFWIVVLGTLAMGSTRWRLG